MWMLPPAPFGPTRRRPAMTSLLRTPSVPRLAGPVLLSILAILAILALPARAEDYPSRPIRVIVPFGAGGPTDVFTRVLGEELRKVLNQPLVMENRPGAGTVIGTEVASKAAPDGYTLLMISATQTVNETLIPNKAYQLMRAFVPG